MPVPWLAIATAAGAGAGLFGSLSSERAQRETNAANALLARQQMEFQERMDNTKYQRGVADARAAGFNPLVAFPGAHGTPIGATATMQNPLPNKGELMLATAKAIADTMLTKEQVQTEQEQQALLKKQTEALEGAAADSKNRRKYAESGPGRATSVVKNVASDIGGAMLGLLGLGGSAQAVKSGVTAFKTRQVLSRFPRN